VSRSKGQTAPPTERPAVDVVLPFRGSDVQLTRVAERLAGLRLRPGDTLTIADNRLDATPPAAAPGAVRILGAGELQTSYHARNRGASLGTAPWLVFLDADVTPPTDLLDRYFDPQPGDTVGVMAGAVIDEPPPAGGQSAAEQYAWLKSAMSQEVTLGHADWPFAQTANAAVRRTAFVEVGGFESRVRSGGDADLCFRLRAAGWTLERRDAAAVTHRARPTVPRMLAQRARHGAGAGWLSRRWPGALPRRHWPGLAWWSIRRAAHGLLAAARGDHQAAVVALLDGPAVWAFELGRLVPNRSLPRPSTRARRDRLAAAPLTEASGVSPAS
jgi:hypothetical protein